MNFSVIIPTRDRPDFLGEAVASVLAQSVIDFEVLIVNDGNGQISLPLDPRIRILHNYQRGPVPARNLGVSEARGDYIAFLDDDDVWIDRQHLAEALRLLQAGAKFTFGNGIMQFPGEAQLRHFDLTATAQSLERDNTILISAVCYEKALHHSLGLFDEALPFYWDWDWYLRVVRDGHHLVHITQSVVDIRIHPQNMSGNSNEAERRAGLDAFAAKHKLGFISLKNHADFVR